MTHDDEYESEWAEVPSPGATSVSDDALGRHLVRRGLPTTPGGLATSIASRIAETKQEAGWRRTARGLRPVAAIAACLVLVLVGSLIATAPRPDASPGSTTVDPAARPLTVAELVRYMGGHPAVGTAVIVDDDIVGLLISCFSAVDCPIGALAGLTAATDPHVADAAYVYPAYAAAQPALGSLRGPFALRIRAAGGFTLLGGVTARSATGLAWSVADVDATTSDATVVVHGWLGASSLEPPCPAPIDPGPGAVSVAGIPLDFSCGRLSFVAGSATTAETTLPDGALRVQNGAYSTFGMGAAYSGVSGLTAPQEGDYLVRRAVAPQSCPTSPDGGSISCTQELRLALSWELIARLDPLSIPAVTTASPTPVLPATTPTIAGPTWDPTQRPLTPPEFLRVLDSRPAPGTVLIVDDQIVPAAAFCPSLGPCPNATLENAPVLVLPPTGGTLTFTTDSSTSTPFIGGPLAIQVGVGPFPVFLGTVVSSGQRLAVTAHDLAARNAMGGLFVVPAWIVAGMSANCPSFAPTAEPTSELRLPPPAFECYATQWLTDTAEQPERVTQNGDSTKIDITPPTDGFEVQPGAYQSFAPDPADDGHRGLRCRARASSWSATGPAAGKSSRASIRSRSRPRPCRHPASMARRPRSSPRLRARSTSRRRRPSRPLSGPRTNW